jgi:hypothetical protein
MYSIEPQNEGEVLYQSKLKSTQPVLTTVVGLGVTIMLAAPAAVLFWHYVSLGRPISTLLLSLALGSLAIVSICSFAVMALRTRTRGVALCGNKLIYDIDSSARSIECSDIVGADKEPEGVSVRTRSGESIYLPEQFIGSPGEMSTFVNCLDDIIATREGTASRSATL